MALDREQLKSELVEQVARRALARLEAPRAEPAERFVRGLYAHVPPEDFLGESVDNLYGAALSLWAFVQERPPETPKVRVYDPRHASHGWENAHTVVELVTDDMPFLVDSVVAALQGLGAEVHLVIHPVLGVERDGEGQISEVVRRREAPEGMPLESIMQVQVAAQPEARHEVMETTVRSVLNDVRQAVKDWQPMSERCQQLAKDLRSNPPPLPEEQVEEGIAFLEWLNQDHFTFLGYREYTFEGRGEEALARVLPGQGLGLLSDDETTVFAEDRSLAPMPDHVRRFLRRSELLVISKAARRSTVHRPVYFDAIGLKLLNEKGGVIGQKLFIGLFTSVAYAAGPADIPILRRKVAHTAESSDIAPGSHDGKVLAHILNTYPRDELFQITKEDLQRIAIGILNIQERHRIAFFPRRDAFERFMSCLVYVPRDRYDTALRRRIARILSNAYEGEVTDFYTHLTDSKLARLHFIVTTRPGSIPEVDLGMLEQKLVEAGRSWADRLEEALIEARGEERGIAAMHRFGDAFSASYQDHTSAQTAVADIAGIEQALETGLALSLYRPLEAAAQDVHFKIFFSNDRVPLSQVLPQLENMGLEVIEEMPYVVRPADTEERIFLRDFVLRVRGDHGIDLEASRETFHGAFRRVWRGEMEDDGFNRLVLSAGLDARQVTVLRALCKYLLQARIPFSQAYMEETLAKNPQLAALLVELFEHRFDPTGPHDTEGEQRLLAAIEKQLETVRHLDEDRIIRRFSNLIQATLRTNYYQRGAAPNGEGSEKPWIAFKFESPKIRNLPRPRPFREIFVYSPRVEAVHLRGGPVARGGIRWSDRREDFRTEVLDLMKAQMVKNTVIIPVGSKGGFVVKQEPENDPAARREEVQACYSTMMRGILDLTDNLSGGEVVPPASVVRYDDDDPYLVVAADKGTATFSDLANSISVEYGFWLGDAFASGGSAGYDHKGMGITAKGAWESVKRHFRELGKDIQTEDFTVIGVGDMSGDVFGNGMLLSRHIRLVAAFNHQHIFLDPNPDAATSFEERQRLFDLGRSTWEDYNQKLLSEGGGIFDRSLKAVPISPQIAKVLGLPEEPLPPADLIQGILKAEVELLWFGGIGTYVKAREESQALVGDRSNDALRVDAPSLRARVVGEGANLGLTQRGRIEFAARGGRLNTDFIDNSAGVDCSDHEVNIKILLGEVEAAGDLTRKQRDELLREMTDEVGQLVLRDNYLQTQAITATHRLGARLLDRTARFMRALERSRRLDRRIESLPDDDTLTERMQKGRGLTRPEIAVLLSYAKMELYEALLASDLPEDPFLQGELTGYFPEALQRRFEDEIRRHRLGREIISTVVANDMVNRVGITFLHEVKERTGRTAGEIARAYLVSREIFALRDLWTEVESQDNQVPADAQAAMLTDCGRLAERATVWFLREEGRALAVEPLLEAYGPGLEQVMEALPELLPEADREPMANRTQVLLRAGVPESVAQRAARLPLLAPCCDIVRIGRLLEVPVLRVGAVYFQVGTRLRIDWLRRAAGQLPSDSAWDKLAVTATLDDLYGHQSELTRRILESATPEASAPEAFETWAAGRTSQVQQTDQLLAELQGVASPNFSMLAVANRQLKSLAT